MMGNVLLNQKNMFSYGPKTAHSKPLFCFFVVKMDGENLADTLGALGVGFIVGSVIQAFMANLFIIFTTFIFL